MTPRATDWGLALLVGLLFATGVMTLFAGGSGDAWVFAAHGAGGFALAAVLGWKLRRVWRRLAQPARWDRRTAAGASALGLVAATVLSGVGWSSGFELSAAGYNLLGWHFALGAALTFGVAVHAGLRAKPIRRRDLAGRRQLLAAGAVAAGSYLAWLAQRPVSGWFGLRGARRRFTGSYEAGSFAGNAFPSTSWVADRPRPLSEHAFRLELSGLVARPLRLALAELEAGDTLVATLDCTGGFYSRQRWGGARLVRLLERAGPLPAASHVRVISHTGYRWSFDLRDARGLLLATSVGGEPLSHEHAGTARRPGAAWLSVGEVGGSRRAARRARPRGGGVDGLEQLHPRRTRRDLTRPGREGLRGHARAGARRWGCAAPGERASGWRRGLRPGVAAAGPLRATRRGMSGRPVCPLGSGALFMC